jgi:hypothetical protein
MSIIMVVVCRTKSNSKAANDADGHRGARVAGD